MPFEISPKFVEAPPKVGRFQRFAEAMLRGCAVTGPLQHALADGRGNACALGAYLVGAGTIALTTKAECVDDIEPGEWSRGELAAWGAYYDIHGTSIADDNDLGRLTREEIAVRIAAL